MNYLLELVRSFALLLLIFESISGGASGARNERIPVPANSFRMRTGEPIMVENKLLPPGTYIWKRLDSLSNRHLVQISDEKTHRVAAMLIAIPNLRDGPADSNEVDYWETPKGYPRAVRAWFLPGDTWGQEFPYPKKMAMILPQPLLPHTLLRRSGAEPSVEDSVKTGPSVSSSKPPSKGEVPAGSWAVITDGASQGARPTAPAHLREANSLWDGLRRLPLTATIAPLIGLVGIVSLALLLLSYSRRRTRMAEVRSTEDSR